MESITCVDTVSNVESDKTREERHIRRREHDALQKTNEAKLKGRSFGISMMPCVIMYVHFLQFLLLRIYSAHENESVELNVLAG